MDNFTESTILYNNEKPKGFQNFTESTILHNDESTQCHSCRICGNSSLQDVIDLGQQVITSRFPIYGDFSTPSTPIVLSLCVQCSLLQLKYSTNSSEMYEHEYGYRSGISNTMKDHLRQYQAEMVGFVRLADGDMVVDIGSNDSTLLQCYDKGLKRVGIDPTGKQFKEFYGDVELIADYFTYDNFRKVYSNYINKVKIVSSISMFYDLPDPVQFAKDIYRILDDDGIWTCEQSYVISMLDRNSIDTICHEHLEYYSLTAVKHIADLANFKMIDIQLNECNGGSFRIYFAKRGSNKHQECLELIEKMLDDEAKYGTNGIKSPELYSQFLKNCDEEVGKLNRFIESINKGGQEMYIYGASTKGNCLLQYAKIDESKIKYAVERNLNKVGKMTSTGIEIISEEQMRSKPPQYLLVLPWHFREEIIKREDVFLEAGGQLVFPFPHFEIYSKKPKVLITGCEGMIAKYVMDEYRRGTQYSLYGFGGPNATFGRPNATFGRPKGEEKGEGEGKKDKYDNMVKFHFDIRNRLDLETHLEMIQPDQLIHLAGISSSVEAFANVVETMEVNGLAVAHICEIIHKRRWKTKLFNASSSEMYKGYVDVKVDDKTGEGLKGEDSINNMFHNHPYSIAKIMAHSTVNFYRTTYGLPFSNGILFTVESKHKKKHFLLNKVAEHCKRFASGDKEPIVLGPLNSYRNLIHASDVAKAIKLILSQEEGNTYVICGDESVKVKGLVFKLYFKGGIVYEKEGDNLYSKDGNIIVIIDTETQTKGLDTVPVNIQGTATRLKELGWKPEYSVDAILDELIAN